MRKRTASVLAVAAALLLPAAAAGQPAGENEFRTPWGDPDLMGTWSYASLTPLQRPESMADKEFFTAEEAAERNLAVTIDRDPPPGSVGSYNALWFDRGRVSSDMRTSLIVDPPNGRLPLRPETVEAQAARRAYLRDHPADSWLDRSSFDRCILGFNQGPPMTPGGYNQNMQLFQTEDHVVVLNEMVHDSRIIPIDGRARPGIDSWTGESRGRWEGDTLVVETIDFSAKHSWRGTTPERHLIERFTRVDEDTLVYEFTITDPATWTAPWTAQVPMRLNELPLFEYACHEGNYSMVNILGGARALEAQADGR